MSAKKARNVKINYRCKSRGNWLPLLLLTAGILGFPEK
jgi:hypothetical protein